MHTREHQMFHAMFLNEYQNGAVWKKCISTPGERMVDTFAPRHYMPCLWIQKEYYANRFSLHNNHNTL